MAKITYHKSHKFVDNNGNEHTFQTQFYQTGIYGILDNDPTMQGSFTPNKIRSIEENLEKQLKEGLIKSYKLGIPITVSNESGLWKEVE